MEDVLIVGAGPCGLAAAIACKRAGLNPINIEKGSLVHSIYRYPTYMIFHSTAELLEIGGIPFSTPNEKPTRQEALQYYRLAAKREGLRINSFETVTETQKTDKGFHVTTVDRFGETHTYDTKNLIIATGYFDNPNRLNVPGEDLAKVSSFYKEAHPYAGLRVAIVGGNNSAVDAAMELERAGAEVTVICRRTELSDKVKAWTRPVFESLINKGRIRMMFGSVVDSIEERLIRVKTGEEVVELENDHVFALIGYRPDRSFLQSLGVEIDPETGSPQHHPETMETNVPGLYIAGVIAAGHRANAIFIENGRFHGEGIARHITSRLAR